MTGVDASISEYNYEDIPKFLDKTKLSFAVNAEYNKRSDDSDQIPLFEDVLKRYPDTPFNVDFKEGQIDLIEEANKLIKKYNHQDKIIWGSFSKETTMRLKTVNPDISRFVSRQEFFSIMFLYYIGLLPF